MVGLRLERLYRLEPLLQWALVSLGRALSDSIFPRRCLVCQELLPDRPNWYLCQACVGEIEPFRGPACSLCGRPFWTFGQGFICPKALCGLCRAKPPPFAKARAFGLYQGPLKGLILRMKYRPEAKVAFALGRVLALGYPKLFGSVIPDVVVPVPLHTERFLEREFDQSVLMGRELGRTMGWPFRRWLRRIRPTEPQSRLSRPRRRANVRGAFVLAPAAKPAGRRVLLVDDVITTGATVEEASRVLVASGAGEVYVYAAARAA
jgi:ComF family protein